MTINIIDAEDLAYDLVGCDCGHLLWEHNSFGCYHADYEPFTECECKAEDDRSVEEVVAQRLGRLSQKTLKEIRKAIDNAS